MRRFLCLSLLLLPLLSPGQKVEEIFYKWDLKKTFSDDNASFYGIVEKTDSGYYQRIVYIHSKSLYMKGLYEDQGHSIRNGYFYFFYPNGNPETYGKYEHGKKEGLWMSFFEDGALMDSGYFRNDNRQTSMSWYRNGNIMDSMVLDEGGNGVYVSWYDNGNLLQQVGWQNS